MKYYETKPQFLSKGIVLCQPGLFCSENTYDPMWKTLKNLEGITTIELSDVVLRATNMDSSQVINELNYRKRNGKITFFKTMFADKIGRVDDQANELHIVIEAVRKQIGESVPIFLVGYSKGGLVNMRYVTLHPGIVTNVTSVGTPYHNSFLQKALSLSDDVLGSPCFTFCAGKIVDLKKGIRELLDKYLSDEDLGSDAFFQKLKSEWDKLPKSKKPYITCIACSQIAFDNDPNEGSDLIVDVSAQKAGGFSDINNTILVSDNFEYINHNKWYEILYSLSQAMAVEVSENVAWGIGEAISKGDILYAFFAFCLAIIPFTWDMGKYDLLHTLELGNKNVCKAVLSALNKSNPYISGGY